MATVTLQGKPISTSGDLPKIGASAPNFTLTKMDLTEISLKDCLGQRTVLNIFPSVDTSVCAMSVRHFNEQASRMKDAQVLCVSADLPFAFKRFCGAENLDKVVPASIFRHPEFGKSYGLTIQEGALKGLLARAVVILNREGQVIYTQLVKEIGTEPDYAAAMAALA